MKSELGILYLSEHNREVIERMLAANELVFEGLFCATPHVFVCSDRYRMPSSLFICATSSIISWVCSSRRVKS